MASKSYHPRAWPLALLHHANGFCGGMWALVVEALGDDFHCLALDARGHGDSSKPEADAAYAWSCFASPRTGGPVRRRCRTPWPTASATLGRVTTSCWW